MSGNRNDAKEEGSGTEGEAPKGRRGRTFKAAVKWSYIMDVGRQATTLIVTFVIAGVLGPASYGVVALATTYVVLLQMLVTQGMVPAIIQRPNLRPEHSDAAFWMVMGASVGLTLLTVPFSGWWADINHTPELAPVVIALSLLLPLQGLHIVQEGLFRRDLDIRPMAVRTNVSVLIGGVVGVVAAVTLRNVWALVAQQLTTGVLELVIMWRFSRWRPRLRFNRQAARELLSFSSGSSLASLGNFLNGRADVLITGVFFGPVAVGLYRFASRLVDSAISVTVSSLQGASLPELSRHQDNPERFAERLVVVMRASALLSLPVLGVLAGVASPLMDAVGDRWDRAAMPLTILCIMGAGRALTMLNGPMLQALGRAGTLAWLSWLFAAISAGSFAATGVALRHAAVADQVTWMSWSRAALWGGLFVLVNIWVLKWATSVSVARVARSAAPSALAGVAAMVVGTTVSGATTGLSIPLARLVVVGTAAALTAVAVLYSCDAIVRTSLARNLAARGWGGYDVAAHAPGQVRAGAQAPAFGAAVAGAALRASEPPASGLRRALARRGWGGFDTAAHAPSERRPRENARERDLVERK